MKTILFAFSFFFTFTCLGQNLSPQEQKELQDRVRQLSDRVDQLEQNKNGSSSTDSGSGLKTTDLQGGTVENLNSGGSSGSGAGTGAQESLTPQQREEMLKTLNDYKKKQEENQKALDELMEEE